MEKQKKRFSSQLEQLGIHFDTSNVTPGDIGICALFDPDFPDVTPNRDPDIQELNETVQKKKTPNKKQSTPKQNEIQNEKVSKSKVKKTKKKLIKLFDQLIDQKTQLKKLTKTSIKRYQEIRDEIEKKDSDVDVKSQVDECSKVDKRIKKVQNDIRHTKNNLDVLMKSDRYNYIRKALKGDSIVRIPPKRIKKSGGKVVFECHYCKFRKPSAGAVETHMVRNHNYAPFECSFCSHITTSSRSLYVHNVRKHNFNSGN